MAENRAEKTAIIYDIEGYRNEDGPGMRTMVFFKGCPLRCMWCSNPFGLSMEPQLIFNQNKCGGCGRCLDLCPASANSLEEGGIRMDFAHCTGCGKCIASCVTDARRISGEQYTVSELFKEVQKHALFFRRNSGGVSLSGGEVLLQSEFASDFLRVCRANYLHTTIETSEYAEWEKFESVARYCDLVFFDLKIFDAGIHKKYTGVDNKIILQNIEKLCSLAKAKGSPNVIIRRLIIEGVTAEEDIIQAAKFVNELPVHPEINLLPFHNFGAAKYAMCGREYQMEEKALMGANDALMRRARELTVQNAPNCRVSVGGGNIEGAAI